MSEDSNKENDEAIKRLKEKWIALYPTTKRWFDIIERLEKVDHKDYDTKTSEPYLKKYGLGECIEGKF